MLTLHHLWLSPACRKVRLALAEKRLDFTLRIEKVWERRPAFLAINPAGDVPVLVDDGDGAVLVGDGPICEYLDECHPEPPLIGVEPLARAETRRLVSWFDGKFACEVSDNLVGEKVMKRFLGLGEPDTAAIRAGLANIGTHLAYIAWLAERRNWLAGDDFSLADIAAAAHLSAVDYLGNVPWDEHARAKEWYARLKSRPSFRPLLKDAIPGLPPPKHYANLDF
ncbi:MAG: glutathione S-transferase family protein [Alphaproteobacteria bacterium]